MRRFGHEVFGGEFSFFVFKFSDLFTDDYGSYRSIVYNHHVFFNANVFVFASFDVFQKQSTILLISLIFAIRSMDA